MTDLDFVKSIKSNNYSCCHGHIERCEYEPGKSCPFWEGCCGHSLAIFPIHHSIRIRLVDEYIAAHEAQDNELTALRAKVKELEDALQNILDRSKVPGPATGTDAIFCFIEADKALKGGE